MMSDRRLTVGGEIVLIAKTGGKTAEEIARPTAKLPQAGSLGPRRKNYAGAQFAQGAKSQSFHRSPVAKIDFHSSPARIRTLDAGASLRGPDDGKVPPPSALFFRPSGNRAGCQRRMEGKSRTATKGVPPAWGRSQSIHGSRILRVQRRCLPC